MGGFYFDFECIRARRERVRRGLERLPGVTVPHAGAVDRERDVILREMEEVNKQHEELILDLCGAASETLPCAIDATRLQE